MTLLPTSLNNIYCCATHRIFFNFPFKMNQSRDLLYIKSKFLMRISKVIEKLFRMLCRKRGNENIPLGCKCSQIHTKHKIYQNTTKFPLCSLFSFTRSNKIPGFPPTTVPSRTRASNRTNTVPPLRYPVKRGNFFSLIMRNVKTIHGS